MDRTRASEACDVGSIPAGGTLKITLDLEEKSSVVLLYKPTVSVFLQDHSATIGATNE